MTLRKMTALALGISSLVALGACAEARPLTSTTMDGRGVGPLANRAAGYELEVLVDGVPAPTFFRAGGSYVLGQQGQRYTLRVANHTGRRIEAVVSVDGRDVVDGRPAETGKRGYLVPAWGQVEIDGWRLTRAEVAAFRFSSVADSYAARTGSAREVGVIGAAIFPERYVPRPRPLELPYSERRREEYDDAPADLEGGGRGADKSAASPPPVASGRPSTRSSSDAAAEPAPSRRHGLGTEFGEAHDSSVREVAFVRASAGTPWVVLGARYDDREGLVALGIDVEPDTCGGWACDRDLGLRETATPFPVTERRYAAPPPCWRRGTCR
ncbi:MAG: hypothetical protein JWM82_2569 [Myxococcales bacterium]|jgi:hypothetical protein|nr:hypothetical protein [Myxococcales bacterium]